MGTDIYLHAEKRIDRAWQYCGELATRLQANGCMGGRRNVKWRVRPFESPLSQEGSFQMDPVIFGKWHIACDPEATRQAHHQISVGGPEACGCLFCQNFAIARSQVYPPAVLSLFKQLGVDSKHEAEVYHLGRLDPGKHLYGGWFHLVGTIASENDTIGPYDMEQGDKVPIPHIFRR